MCCSLFVGRRTIASTKEKNNKKNSDNFSGGWTLYQKWPSLERVWYLQGKPSASLITGFLCIIRQTGSPVTTCYALESCHENKAAIQEAWVDILAKNMKQTSLFYDGFACRVVQTHGSHQASTTETCCFPSVVLFALELPSGGTFPSTTRERYGPNRFILADRR